MRPSSTTMPPRCCSCSTRSRKGREAIVSRGELIEIGGAFRMPDIMAAPAPSWSRSAPPTARTRRTMSARSARRTGLILKVHTSNYRIEGFTKEVRARELAALAREHNVPLVNDLGSGTLVDLARFGLAHEPTVAEAIADGADLVTFSGDKLLGGPQAGFIVGRKDLIAQDQPQPDEARAARRQDPARGARGDAAALPRSGSACRAAADAAPAGAAQGGDRGAARSGSRRPSPRALGDGIRGRRRRLREPDRLRRPAARDGAERRACDPSGAGARRRTRADRARRGAPRAAGPGDRPHRGSGADARPALPRRRDGFIANLAALARAVRPRRADRA